MYQLPREGECFECVAPIVHWPKFVRVVAIIRTNETVWLIGLGVGLNEESGKRKRHRSAPFKVSLTTLCENLVKRTVVPISMTVPALWSKSDDEIRASLPLPPKLGASEAGERGKYAGRPEGECVAIYLRDLRYALIRELVKNKQIVEILEERLLPKWIREQGLHSKRRQVYDAFNAYVAGNQNKNSLLPNFDKCGARGTIRIQKKKIGRPNALARYDQSAPKGKLITEEDRELLKAGYEVFINERNSVPQAYQKTMEAFYAASRELVDGKTNIVLLPADRIPSEKQFRYWGSLLTGESARKKRTSELKYQKNERPLPGRASDGIPGFGFKAVCDATPFDVHGVSVTDPLECVGVPHRILIADMFVDYRWGFDISYEAPCASTALAAIYHAARDKVEYCDRYGVKINAEDWFSCLPLQFFADGGEFNCTEVNEVLESVHSGFEKAPTGRADLKPIESAHHSDHAKLDHTLPGTTRGRPRARGEAHPALDARLNINQLTTLYIQRTLHHNNKERVDHLLTAEMARDKVRPYRRDILIWCIDHGYIAHNPYDQESLRGLLLPKLPAVLTEKGVFLTGKQHGSYDKILTRARFVSDYLVTSGLMEDARRNGRRRVVVRGLGTDLTTVWLQTTSDGLQKLTNVSHEELLNKTGSIHDLLAFEDQLLRASLQARTDTNQANVDLASQREDVVSKATQTQKHAESLVGRKRSKKEKISNIEKNRAREIKQLKAEVIERDDLGVTDTKTETDSTSPCHASTVTTRSAVSKSMQAYRDKRKAQRNDVGA